ncbi:acyl-CoA N-acyltransferase [Podospora didyma]|uniref:Acyl-CoA N-acyltransferase n=1 Tax=Podospora didyma TaxID=330526 RepID=A0AAE0NS18_9PEZI|nr:acyl-CoA N-acyltransferase [Podospora didyma]
MSESQPKIRIRQATAADVPAIADIGFRAFANEPIDAHWFPFKGKYPQDYHRAIADEASMRMVTPGHVIMVAEIGEEADQVVVVAAAAAGTREISSVNEVQHQGSEQGSKAAVVAYAAFVKYGSAPEDLARWNPDSGAMKVQRAIFHMKSFITSKMRPNRAIDEDTINRYFEQATSTYMQHLSPGQRAWIDCRGLAVDPEYQRRGYGEKLIRWAGDAAKREGVPIFGDSTATGLPLYLKNGAVQIGRVELPARMVERKGGEKVSLNGVDAVLLKWQG